MKSILILALAAALPLMAQEADTKAPKICSVCGKEMQPGDKCAKMLEKYDANGDGKLDKAEKKTMRSDRKEAREEKLANMSPKKRERMEARQAKRQQENLTKYDANGDGKLDKAERQTMRASKPVVCGGCRKEAREEKKAERQATKAANAQ